MYKNCSILAVIPAKRESVRLPNKNIKPFTGKPLIAWTIEEAKKSRYLDKIVLSTDSKKIAAVGKKYGADIPFLRPTRLSKNKIPAADITIHAGGWFQKKRCFFDIIILLQPTSPLRRAEHIDGSIRYFFKKKADSLISVVRADKSFSLFKIVDKRGYLRNVFKERSLKNINAHTYYIANGAIYIARMEALLLKKTFYLKRTIHYLMHADVSVDIDTPFDFKMAEMLMLRKVKKQNPVKES